ncbi:30S ribosomal protein S18 [bacterium (Candidatus Gribaldobacteria) CG_4_10_14_0_8_um_filter_33_9]|uniref:Small ribosomal subunit protein bS18 n=1 Tax=bacterium (Candidatus Gribaldobacteria) CG_4_10_14_0_8_um_filter_33_9 TaxID=2014266 RepID=A0A2M7RNP2_9BACT|nr:MAG: 30S ribosomal protein S18 [bacterium (Candidatus Gribaldobacteria) CG_4_10_14_0_8_um_filter_33_9]
MHCYFCQKNIKDIDFKNTKVLEGFVSAAGKIKARKKTNLCSFHQRKTAQAIKRARFLALLPYVKE